MKKGKKNRSLGAVEKEITTSQESAQAQSVIYTQSGIKRPLQERKKYRKKGRNRRKTRRKREPYIISDSDPDSDDRPPKRNREG
jgi:hypothetical protein